MPKREAARASARSTVADAARELQPRRSRSQPDGRKGILVRAKPDAWRALKILAVESDRTLQDVMVEAINDFLRKHKRPPVA